MDKLPPKKIRFRFRINILRSKTFIYTNNNPLENVLERKTVFIKAAEVKMC